MKLSNLRKEERKDQIALIADVESKTLKQTNIWISVPKEYETCLVNDRYDGFLIFLSYIAMTYGEDLEIDGKVSKRLLRNFNKYVQDIFLAYNSDLRRIKITAKETTSDIISSAKHIGTGFSGGVDSFSTIYDNYVLENDTEYKIDTLIFFNAGTHGKFNEERTTKLFDSRFEFLKQYPQSINLPYISVDSNLHQFNDEKIIFHMTTGCLGQICSILSLSEIFKRYYIASAGFNYDAWISNAGDYKYNGKQNRDMAIWLERYFDLFSTETTEIILDGSQYNRVQKTLNIFNYPLAKQFLNVCLVNEPQKKNCGICSKCARVGLTLSTINKLNDIRDIFDIESYKKNEFRLMCEAVSNYKINVYMKDIVDFAKINGIKYPSYFVSVIYMKTKWCLNISKRIACKIFGKKLTVKIKSIVKEG